ncbi:MAG TPA: hypothetical protein VFQ77_09035 [Pseudonocardiaceae bacterium]|nr:hypothetical protein [Pseudonocardiaceae bacterium]
MTLSTWTKTQDVSYRTALSAGRPGTLPAVARQLPTGTILVDPRAAEAGAVPALRLEGATR